MLQAICSSESGEYVADTALEAAENKVWLSVECMRPQSAVKPAMSARTEQSWSDAPTQVAAAERESTT
jgi:hypothetical protein